MISDEDRHITSYEYKYGTYNEDNEFEAVRKNKHYRVYRREWNISMSKLKRRLLFSLRPITSITSSLYDRFDLWSMIRNLSSFQDRDGTLKSYSCAYSASIQPAYSGVIQVISLPSRSLISLFSSQAQFARRCAQTCAILTTAPMMNMGILDVGTIPEG